MDSLKIFCDRVCDQLFDSIDTCVTLSRPERRVLHELWARASVRTQSVEDYPGHASIAASIGMTPRSLVGALARLERKGFIKATGSSERGRQLAYLLNALLLEAAFDAIKAGGDGAR